MTTKNTDQNVNKQEVVLGGNMKNDQLMSPEELKKIKAGTEVSTSSAVVDALSVIGQLIYSMGGLIIGGACILGGIILFLNGIAGSTNWTAKVLGIESELSDATPGVILFVVGLFVVWVSRYTIKKKNGTRK